ncbi:four helix bundle protein [Hymenobacter sp.]|uniref:four helix bundle protein n=1 Tax=Hymenobacter sp. TaxID=1898978 RepID=UPI00286B008C|nr:four helix bundle protein [Hymenobacter sp.]
MFDFRKLRIWQEGYALTLQVYKLTRSFPRDELFGLTGQMRRAANSVPHNIAEGCGRNSRPELLRFIVIAMGSASELESETLVAQGLGFLETEMAEKLLNDIQRLRKMLAAYYQKVHAAPGPATRPSSQAPKLPSPHS